MEGEQEMWPPQMARSTVADDRKPQPACRPWHRFFEVLGGLAAGGFFFPMAWVGADLCQAAAWTDAALRQAMIAAAPIAIVLVPSIFWLLRGFRRFAAAFAVGAAVSCCCFWCLLRISPSF